MALPNDYAGQACSMARALEIIGARGAGERRVE
jgi:hypothetical protein